MTQPLTFITAAADGTVYGIAPGGNGAASLVQIQPDAPWTSISGQQLTSIGAASDGTVWGLGVAQNNQPPQVLAWNGDGWTDVPCSYTLTQIAVGAAAYVWAIDGNGVSYQYTTGSGWTPQGGSLSSIVATSDGSVWGIDSSGSVQQYSASGWQSLTEQPQESLSSLGAGSEVWAWGIGKTSGTVYQYDGVSEQWATLQASAPNPLRSIFCGDDTTVFATDIDATAYQFNYDTEVWDPVPDLPVPQGVSLAILSVGDATDIWALDTSHNVYQFTQGGIVWTPVTSSLSLATVSAGSATNVWATDQGNNVYQIVGGNPNQPLGTQQCVSVGADATVCGISGGQATQYLNGAWGLLGTSSNMTSISAGSAQNIWALSTVNGVTQTYRSSGGSWSQVPGPTDPTTAASLTLTSISAASDGSVWGATDQQQTCVYLGPENGWYVMPVSLRQVAAGSITNVWGIDSNGNAINPIFSSPAAEGSTESVFAEGSIRRKRRAHGVGWDTESVFDETESTHLWIVNRAAQLAGTRPTTGMNIADLVQPYQGTASTFHNSLCQGLYDADFVAAYNNPKFGHATYKSHFWCALPGAMYGKNWLFQTSPTALTQCRAFFWMALTAYLNNDMANAGYYLGLSLHYLTDVTQPMHAINLTALVPYKYHTCFESWVLEMQATVPTLDPTSINWMSGVDPGDVLIQAATNSAGQYGPTISDTGILTNWDNDHPKLTGNDRQFLAPIVPGMLQDAMRYTALYLSGWMEKANSDLQLGYLVNAGSAMVMDVRHGSSHQGAPLWQYPWNNTGAQRFTFTPLTGSDAGYYTISPHCSSSLVLDVQSGTNQVIQNPPNGSDTQKWSLSVPANNNDSTNNDPNNDAVPFTILNKGANQWCLSVQSPASGAKSMIVLADPTVAQGQYWILTPAAPVSVSLLNVGFNAAALVADVPGGTSKPGTQLQVWAPKQNIAQQFLFVPLTGADEDYYMILSAASGLCLYLNGNSVVQQAWDATDSAKWAKVPVSSDGNQYVSIQNKATQGFWGVSPNTDPVSNGAPMVCSTAADWWAIALTVLMPGIELEMAVLPETADRVMHAGG